MYALYALFAAFEFFATGFGLLTLGLIATLMILFWDWRISLVGLVVIQFGVATIAVLIHDVTPQWEIVQTFVIILCSLILALSGTQLWSRHSLRQSGNWFLRGLAVILLLVAWRLLEIRLPVPELDPQVTVLLAWLGVCALMILGLCDTPLFTGIALLLWFIPMHVITAILLPIPGLIVILGVLELLVSLACSYLILTENYTLVDQQVVSTDITFPEERLLPDNRQVPQLGLIPLRERTTLDLEAVPRIENRVENQNTNLTSEHPIVRTDKTPDPTPSRFQLSDE